MKKTLSVLTILMCVAGILSADSDSYRFTVQFNPGRISWNPHFAYTTTEAQIFTALYEGLAVFHPATLRPVPGAAESWEVSEDGMTITFQIRKDAKWSNGEDLTADDFRESWLAILAPEIEAEYASLLDDIEGAREYRTGVVSAEDVGITTDGQKKLIVRLKTPSPQFLSIVCHYSFAPVHRDFRQLSDWSAVRSVPVNGPFVIRARNSEEILMDSNPFYHDKDNVGVEGLRFLFLDDSDEVMSRFSRFEIDWVISGMDTSLLTIPEALNISPLFSTTYYYFSNQSEVWSDERVRRALALLLPWEEILGSRFIPALSLVPPIPNYPEAGAGFPIREERLDEALTLLEEAGYPLGKGLPDPVLKVPMEDDFTLAMKQAWEEALGLTVIVEVVEYPDYYTSIKTGGYDIATLTWTGDYADPYTFLGMWDSHSSFNESGFSNPEFDSLLKDSTTLAFQERFNTLRQAEDILLQSCQVMPIEHFPSVNIIDRRFVEGWYPNALDIHPFKDLKPKLGYDIPGVAMR